MARAVRWDLIADPRKYQKGFRDAEQTTKRFSGTVTKTGNLVKGALVAGLAGIGGAAVIGGFKTAIDSASDLNETISKTNVIFGSSAKEIRAWSQGSARSMGLSRQEALASAASFGDMFLQLKLGRPQAVNMSKSMVELAADFASFHNADITQVLEAQSAAFRGEYDSIQRFIPGITAARVEQVALNQTHKDSAKELTAAEKATAAYSIMLKDGAKAVGDFDRTSKGAANQQRILRARFEDVKAQLGQELLPAFTTFVTFLNEKLPAAIGVVKEALKAADKWWDENQKSVKLLAEVLGGLFVTSTDEAATSTGNLTKKTIALSTIFNVITEGVLRLVIAFLHMEKKVNGLISTTASFITATGHAVNAVDRLSGGTGRAGDRIVKFGEDLKDTARRELRGIKEDARKAQEAIDRLHGKKVDITGTTSLQFTKTFTQKDWVSARLAAGRMATGGKVPGGWGGGDRVPILAEPGEAVVDKYRTSKYASVLGAMGVPGFQLGGKVDQTGQAHSGVGRIMDRWGTLQLAALVKNLVGGAGSAAIKSWIRAQDPKPYIWGAAGPGGFDCSGLVSAVLGKMLGLSGAGSGRRLFTTSTIGAGQYGLRSGLGGVLQIGVTPGRGHMAGRYGGLGFEAESSRTGIKVGPAASPPESFARRYHHMARGGRITREMLAVYAGAAGADIGGDPGALRIGGTRVFDRGGFLPPRSATLAINRTSRAEPVGLDYDRLGEAVARALQQNPPVVAVRDLQVGMNRYAGRVGQARPYR